MSSTPSRFVAYAASEEEIERCARTAKIGEILLEPEWLACQGTLSAERCVDLARSARSHGLRPVLVWDILLPERVMQSLQPSLSSWAWEEFAAVRVCDIGAAQWLRIHRPQMPLQLIVETGNHNEDALRAWCAVFAPALERLILSIEIPEERLIAYARESAVDCEVMGVGRILLFYSPRSLLAPKLLTGSSLQSSDAAGQSSDAAGQPSDAVGQSNDAAGQPSDAADQSSDAAGQSSDAAGQSSDAADQSSDAAGHKAAPVRLEAISGSDLSGYRPLPVLETAHGTFLYLDKDQFILDRLSGLLDAGLWIRLDLRHLRDHSASIAQIDGLVEAMQHDATALRQAWPRPTRAPFFKNNKTTAQFTRLKANHHEQRDEYTLAEVVGVERRRYVVLCALRPFSTEMLYALLLPSGEEILLTDIPIFHDLQGVPRNQWMTDQLLITERIRMACPGALLRGRSKEETTSIPEESPICPTA
ncbi:U32 family peptidase [Myxococcota bacterium]|nr:U32 family peptidase [Myxococcota bacterium]